jgi:hypothetical protein
MKLIKDRLFLRKVVDSYVLHRIKDNILTIEGDSQYTIGGIDPFYKLSKQNCDSIFGVVDVDKLAKEYVKISSVEFDAYKAGFNKAMELNKDKVFTLEDMRNAMNWVMTQYYEFYEQPTTARQEYYLESLQQPTEIEVEFVMDILNEHDQPKLDSEGCLILKKI